MLAVRDISRAYGPTRANDHVSLEIGPGEIVGLMGENGAGKSTLLSIIAGFQRPDSGVISVSGTPLTLSSPAASIMAGIGMVHQHLSLVPSFTVREQLALAGWRARSLPAMLAADFDGSEAIAQLPLGKRQRLEIAKAMVANPTVLLLDEPTSILAPSEVDGLFALLTELRGQGTSIVIVSHKIHEVMSIADRVIVMAGGRVTGEFGRMNGAWPPGTDVSVLARMFTSAAWRGGEAAAADMTADAVAHGIASEAALMAVESVNTGQPGGSPQLHDVTFDVLPGRIHAVTGVDGQGQTELAEVIAGYRPATGRIFLDGSDISMRPAVGRAEAGIGLLVDDRLGGAAVPSFSVAENVVLKRPRPAGLRRMGFFRRREVTNRASRIIEAWDVQPPWPDARFDELSGGNMQRVLAARELDRLPRVLVALNPFQGLDARTSEFLLAQFRALCGRGGAVLFFTTDLDEAVLHGDLLAVIREGRISPMVPPSASDRLRYGSMMVNGW